MGTNNYRKTNHEEKCWLEEIDFICTPKKTKHWIKKYLSGVNRQKIKNETRKEEAEYHGDL